MKTKTQSSVRTTSHASVCKDTSPWWRKLFSSNWWWYGEVNPDPAILPPPEMRPKLWRARVCFGFLICTVGVFAPTVSALINYGIPAPHDLQKLHGEVIATNELSPHLQIKLASGEIVKAEFPVFIMYFGGFGTKHFKEPVHKLALSCKQVIATGSYLSFVPQKRFRIWEFRCMNGAFSVPHGDIRRDWLNDGLKAHLAMLALCVFTFFGMFIERYLREKNSNVRKN